LPITEFSPQIGFSSYFPPLKSPKKRLARALHACVPASIALTFW
jgi:hypothetical protein